MKKIECMVRPSMAGNVRKALTAGGILGMTVTDVTGAGRQKGFTEKYRVSEVTINLLPKVKFEVVVKDEDVQKAVDIILEAARTGEIGDGKIFVSTVEETYRIRTGEKDEEAL
ncbi:MAG: P-II family nitrogen regulator [Candidatus Hydrothermarchaeales archaeon]